MKKFLAITSTVTFLGMFAVLASAQRPNAPHSTPGYYNSRYDPPRTDYRDRYDDHKRRNDRDRRDDRYDRDHHHHHDHDRYHDRRRDDYRNRGYVDYRNRGRYEKSRGNCGPRDRDKRRW